eukprot:gene16489-18129_t
MIKPLKDVPRTLQGFRLRLQNYNITVQYKPGSEQYIADRLSRSPQQSKESCKISYEIETNAVSHVLIGEQWRKNLLKETNNDEAMKELKDVVTKGWPEDKSQVPERVKPYFKHRDELAIHDALIYRGERVIVPRVLRPAMKEEIHNSHLGIQACLRRARECVFWPAMNAEIKDYISECDICQSYGANQQRETLFPVEIPERPWQIVSTDLCDWNGNNYLVTVDHYSNFIEVDKLPNTLSKTVIKKLKTRMSRYRQCDIVISDNGPQFISNDFESFAKSWNFIHHTSSPYHSQGNGRAEAAVKIAKRIMSKARDDKKDAYKALLAYRNTIQDGLTTSPAQRFLGRRNKTDLPITGNLLRPGKNDAKEKSDRIIKQERTEKSYNKQAKDLHPLNENDSVRVRPVSLRDKIWVKAKVLQRLDERSYLLNDDKRVFRRNRVDLRKVPNKDDSKEKEDIPVTESQDNFKHNTPCDQSKKADSYRTRSGRQVVKPKYLRDYV